jgi:hypothetical protein
MAFPLVLPVTRSLRAKMSIIADDVHGNRHAAGGASDRTL